MPQLEVDGAVLTYDDEGPRDGDGVPLVFVHGWTANRHRWDHQVAHFSGKRRVIRLDLRGHGESRGAGVRTIEELAEDVLALLDHLEVQRFVLVGHSMGGMISQTITLAHPERVERLVLVNSIGRMTYSRGRGLLMAVSTRVPFKLFVAANIQRAFAPGYPREQIREYIRASAATPREVVMTLYGAMRAFDVLDRLGEISTPTLLVHGYHDIQLPVSQMLRMATACQDAEVRILDAGHELPVEKPAELTATLDRFLTGARP
ncbi:MULTISPECIES: alpha/beta fold hydrolase [Streptomyces]|uniref:Putative 3-oxoadipate enol-lactone hydrolase n=1 Tax=Streptomyces scabiei (strain 87.22) TaxID=680198 RepID=C9YYR0_STRSW|nr:MULTISPECIES: alpha/beta fold hydrolase [Streptomyces]MBP5859616.1 alpha/beta fold hydrolase [Streptomyces sp. LBUM 1484]MBP5871695.1 alpha/beta fold hydrolase [Streptomyces sp. LBUM 1485]MBP5909798.1 alpha/beta fold hydrolase [Streptomyces sp. LBUM 1478]MBP5926981.1 alpha/beta fold hydrolase [Streptomyces sp. LBUM 1479]KFG06624.1 carboxylesterase [Streptomyces scabiei]